MQFNFPGYNPKITSSTLTTSTQQQSTDNTDGRHQQKFHDNNKHFIKNYFSRGSSIFQTAVKPLFNNRHNQSQVRHTCRYGLVHKFKISDLLRTQLNTTFPADSSAAEARTSISAASIATTEQKRTRRDNEERLQTDFNSNRSTTNFLILLPKNGGRVYQEKHVLRTVTLRDTKS